MQMLNTLPDNSEHQIARRKNAYLTRFGAGLVPALMITTGLFMGMQAMTTVDDFELPNIEVRELVAFIAESEPPEEVRRRRKAIAAITAKPPPPLPPPVRTVGKIDLPDVVIEGAAPDMAGVARVLPMSFQPITINERRAKPIRPPVPTYPEAAARDGVEGKCDVSMDVTAQGRPYNVTASCSHPVFKREAERSVQRVEFLPRIVRGRAVEMRGVVYPLVFELEG